MGEKKLAGKVAMITSTARGIGRGCALRLAGLGADVAIIDRNLKGAEVYKAERESMTAPTVIDECKALGVRAMGIEVDLAGRAATEKAVADVVDELGRIDIAVCVADGGFVSFADELESQKGGSGSSEEGKPVDIMTTGTPSDCPENMLTRVIDLNLYTCMYTCMAVAPYMKKQKSGRIVATSSVMGVFAQGEYHPYGTARAPIIHYTSALAQKLGPYNINVNCMVLGLIHTARFGDRSELAHKIPLRRQGTVEDCAKIVEFLMTVLSDYVTGTTIAVDGGAKDVR